MRPHGVRIATTGKGVTIGIMGKGVTTGNMGRGVTTTTRNEIKEIDCTCVARQDGQACLVRILPLNPMALEIEL